LTETAGRPATQDIVVEEFFPHAPDTIWKTLTTGELVGRWLGMQPSEFAAVKGTRFTFQTTPAHAWDGIIHCEVLEVKRNERLVYSWQGGHESNAQRYGSRLDTIVTWTLTEVEGGTRLRLVHSGFVTPSNDSAFRTMSGGWKKVVGRVGVMSGEQPETGNEPSGKDSASDA
jgi:uncharacterized protein YndB with AHSA1/START domain